MAVVWQTVVVGSLAVNSYLVARDDTPTDADGTRPCVIIDPGDASERLVAECGRRGWRVAGVLLTHAHYDHIGGVAGVLAAFPDAVLACSAETARRAVEPRLNLSILLGAAARAPAASRHLSEGGSFTMAGVEWRADGIPGHEPGELVYYVKEAGCVFSGDTVFAGGIGRSDFPGGDGVALVETLRAYLGKLPPETCVCPGHGPATTAARELRHNPFLRQ